MQIKRVVIMGIAAVMLLTLPGCGQSSDEIEELEERIEELEEENDELRAKLKDAGDAKESASEDSEVDNFVVETSGVCGADLTWEYGNGILKIHGTGDMTDYDYDNRPWEDIKDKVGHVYVDEGVTSIGTHSFGDMELLSKVTIPSSVKELPYDSFVNGVSYPAADTAANDTRTEEEKQKDLDEALKKGLNANFPAFQKLIWGKDTYTDLDELFDVMVK